MKLNPDCIRDVLLYLEEHLHIEDRNKLSKIELKELKEKLTQYSEDDIFYSVYNLHQIRFINGRINDNGDRKMLICEINNITWDGHQFLNTIRPDTIWQATKKGASKIGLMSMHALSNIAMKLSEAIISDSAVIAKIVSML